MRSKLASLLLVVSLMVLALPASALAQEREWVWGLDQT